MLEERINDAMFLWEKGKKESAFLLALTCVAALSRKYYPNEKDGEAFRKMFQKFRAYKMQVEFRGKLEPIENIFYKWVRCELVHEGGLPTDITFLKEKADGVMTIRAGGKPDYTLQIGEGWFFHLTESVKRQLYSPQ